MESWEYRAYDKNFKTKSGIAKANNFPELAVNLRQSGLQIIHATKIHPNEVLARNRLDRMKSRLYQTTTDSPTAQILHNHDKKYQVFEKIIMVLIKAYDRVHTILYALTISKHKHSNKKNTNSQQ